jgi:transcriptional regulator with XRE-family HTH domain
MRANVSVAWYTWLEQGRGGLPSNEVLERLARALELDDAGREMLFLLAQQRPPALQRVLDGMPNSPAIVKTPTWDVLAWNAAAAAVLTDYAALPVRDRNLLRLLFGRRVPPAAREDWLDSARLAVGVFRIDVARGGGDTEAAALAAELQATSPEFRELWAENEVRSHWVGTKRLQHSLAGTLTLEYSGFSVGGEGGLSMIVFTPATLADARAIETLVSRNAQAA